MTEKTYPFWKVSSHIFILGAGASTAAFPDGDKYGRKLPLMSDFIDTLDLAPILERHNIDQSNGNIEDIYDEVYASNPDSIALAEINDRIYSYFSILEIPDNVTLYDRLLLSLQKRDMIFSFNWDPLLLQAFVRNRDVEELPSIRFLHGNVAIGVCTKDKRVGHEGNSCSICHTQFEPSKLLYPIKNKDYRDDPFISNEWKALESALNDCFILTLFGYSAPRTDVLAIEMMEKAWKSNSRFEFNEIEVIDIQSKEKVEDNWSRFIHKTHYSVFNDVNRSLAFKYSRRSCNAWGDSIMMLEPWSERQTPKYKDLKKMQDWVIPLVKEERDFRNNDIEIPKYCKK